MSLLPPEDDRIAILERALRWYANPTNWTEDDWGVLAVVRGQGYGDPTRKARSALKRAGCENVPPNPRVR